MHLDTYTFTDIHILTDTHVFSCVLIRHTHPQVYIHALPHSQMCTLLHTITHIPPYPHSHTLIIISACTHIHTHTHTHTKPPRAEDGYFFTTAGTLLL